MVAAVLSVNADASSSRTPLPSAAEISRLPADGGEEFNRLVHESSPYLLQHARNPVDWHPWGDAAFDRAKREDKPVFLSVGYSTCHWCHVMERESFERDDVAAVLNKYFVCVKVDREERPEVDEIYMNATQVMTGRGGWPNSVWLLPDGRPWFAGTYFPRESFLKLLARLSDVWTTRRKDIEAQAAELTRVIGNIARTPPADTGDDSDADPAALALEHLRSTFDAGNGGFGRAPKFPPHHSLRLLLHLYEKTGNADALAMATRTLDAMALGGIRDHVGGGFHRYATDAHWFLPHFEKMLYDNAMLAYAYAEAWRLTANEDYRGVAEETLDWVLRDMTHPEGGFYSALDADSEGEEGRFYVWRHDELTGLLGTEEGTTFADLYGATADGNFHEEATGKRMPANILSLSRPLREAPTPDSLSLDGLAGRLKRNRDTLLAVRNKRVWPHLDDKVLVSWNGLMIGSMARSGSILRRPRYVAAARRAADFILAKARRDGRLMRYWRDGKATGNAYLDDYAFIADGLLDLHDATNDSRYLDVARQLVGVLDAHYRDTDTGAYCLTADDHEALIVRSKSPYDQAIPSGNGVAARVFVRLAGKTGERQYAQAAEDVFAAFGDVIRRQPTAVQTLVLAHAMSTKPPGAPDDGATLFPVTVRTTVLEFKAVPGETVTVPAELTIVDGWHIGAAREPGVGRPTAVALVATDAVELADIRLPDGKAKEFAFAAGTSHVYERRVRFEVDLRVPYTTSAGTVDLALDISFQACNDRTCRAPGTVRLPVTVEMSPRAPARHARGRKTTR